MGLILDSSVIVARERQGLSVAGLLASVGAEPIALSTVSVIELEHAR